MKHISDGPASRHGFPERDLPCIERFTREVGDTQAARHHPHLAALAQWLARIAPTGAGLEALVERDLRDVNTLVARFPAAARRQNIAAAAVALREPVPARQTHATALPFDSPKSRVMGNCIGKARSAACAEAARQPGELDQVRMAPGAAPSHRILE